MAISGLEVPVQSRRREVRPTVLLARKSGSARMASRSSDRVQILESFDVRRIIRRALRAPAAFAGGRIAAQEVVELVTREPRRERVVVGNERRGVAVERTAIEEVFPEPHPDSHEDEAHDARDDGNRECTTYDGVRRERQ